MNRVAAIQKSSRTRHEGLDAPAVALAQGVDQLGAWLAPPGEEPLLELVEHEQDLARPRQRPAAPEARPATRPGRSPAGSSGHALRRPREQPGFGLVGRRLDVDGPHVAGQPRQQARLDQRRLAAARRAVDQADAERLVRVGRLDPVLPEPQALRQAVAVARAGQELEEEVGVVLVERPQALGDDPDRAQLGSDRAEAVAGAAPFAAGGTGAVADGGRRGAARRPSCEKVPQVIGQVAGGACIARWPAWPAP